MSRKVLIVVGGIVVLLLLAAVIIPHLIDVNQFKPKLEADLEDALGGRKVSIGNIALTLLPGVAVDVQDVSIADDPAFSKSPFLAAKNLKVGVNLMPLIFSKRLEVRSFTVESPEVNLLRNSAGTWNFSTLSGGASKSKAKSSDSSSATNFSVEKLAITNGRITVGTVGSRAKPQVYDNVGLEASDLSYTTQFPFKLTAKTPGGGTAELDGKAGPIDANDASLTPLNAKIEIKSLDLAATGFLSPSAGIGGVVDFKGDIASNGRDLNSTGTAKVDKLKAAPNGTPARVPVNVNYATTYDLKKQSGNLKQGDVHIAKALAQLTGTYSTAGESTSLQMKLNGQAMPVPDLEGVLPAVGVTLPSGASLQSGTLNVNLSISGPLDKLVITGPVNMANAKMAGFNLGSKLGALQGFTGLGGGSKGSDTEIQTLSTNLRVASEGTHAQDLNLVVPSIGTVTGDANISPEGKLNCKMVAALSGGVGSALGQASGGFLGGGGKGGSSGIPFLIQGTTSNPIFLPDMEGLARGMLKNQLGNLGGGKSNNPAGTAAGALGGLLGKPKK